MRSWSFVAFAVLLLSGCKDAGPRLVPVTGNVKFVGGQVPKGEVMVIRFEPTGSDSPSGPQVAGKGTAAPKRKAAGGDIKPDGSFTLTTNNPSDGAYEGQYKVTLSIFKTYKGHESMIPKRYEKATDTPLEATVKAGDSNAFTFEIESK